ncbi:GntR family transcriptional regulator [Streptomyces albidoflavus]
MPEPSSDARTPHAPYMRVLEALTADIETKKLGPGARIPSEAELCKRHKVARETARRAVRVLRERGVVRTEWGRGTFVVGAEGSAGEGEPSE